MVNDALPVWIRERGGQNVGESNAQEMDRPSGDLAMAI